MYFIGPRKFLFLFLFLILAPLSRAEECQSNKPRHHIESIFNRNSYCEGKIPPHDYGDRTKLSALILCAMLGFTGAHHFYMKRYLSAGLQLAFFLISLMLSITGTAVFFAWLFLLALWAWVAADFLLIIFGGFKLKKGKKLIPFEQHF